MFFILYLLIKRKAMRSLLKELADWEGEGCTVVVSGAIEKRENDGFIILRWEKPIPSLFRRKLEVDPNIIDAVGISITHAIQIQAGA